MDVCVLVGNGLSVAVRPEFTLPALRDAFLNALPHADRVFLEQLGGDPAENLEEILANVEILRDSLHAVRSLSVALASPDLQQIAQAVTNTHLDERLDRLYYIYCSVVLERLGEAWNPEEVRNRLEHWLEHVEAWLDAADEAHFFTLNFDLLLEHCLLNAEMLDLRYEMTDFFQSYEGAPDAWWPPDVPAYEFAPGTATDRAVRLYHLHGSLACLMRRSTSEIFKMRAEDVRGAHVYDHRLPAQALPANWTPAVIIGGRKERKAAALPYSFAFDQLRRSVTDPGVRVAIVVGYSFNDPHVNTVLGTGHEDLRWIVIDHQPPANRAAFSEWTLAVLQSDNVRFYFDGANDPDLPRPDE